MRLRGIALLFLAVQGAAATQNPTASIEGLVVESGTNNTLAKTTVELRALTDSTVLYPAFSSGDGRFIFRSVTPGRYALSATHAGYLRAEYGQRGPNGSAAVLVVASGQRLTDVRLSMTPSSAISGRVSDREGEPVANAQMHAWKVSYPEGWRVLTPINSQMTDDRGEFRLFGLPPGQYFVSAQPEPRAYIRSPAYASLAPPVPGAVIVSNIAGSTGGTADPANGLRATGADWMPVYYGGTTDEYTAAQLDLGPGDDIRGIDIAVDRIAMASVRGSVIDGATGQPVRMATVAVTPMVPGLTFTTLSTVSVLYGKMTVAPLSSFPVRANGEFVLPLVARGTYLLTALADQQGRRLAGQTLVDLVNTSALDAKVVVLPTAEISGHLIFEGRAPGAAEPDAAGLRIGLTSVIAPILEVAPTPLSNLNAFTLRNVAPGEYLINVFPLSNVPAPRGASTSPSVLKNVYVKSARLGDIDMLSEGFRFATAAEGQLEIVIGSNPGGVGGTVAAANGATLAEITVALLPEESHRNRIDLYRSMVTDADGRYRFEGVPPGRYKLFAWEDVEKNSWRNPSFMRIHEGRGASVTVVEGAEESADLTVIPLR